MKRWLFFIMLAVALLAVRRAWVPDPLEALSLTAQGFSGSWWFPRGGPYILGYESSAPAKLFIDGENIVSGSGQKSARRIYEAGPHAVLFTGSPGSQLLWHPPGRRGALEYVPPSSLSPSPPDSARFTNAVGASRVDAPLAALLVLGAAITFLHGARLRAPRRTLFTFGLIFALALAARLLALSQAGQTWDEDEYWSAGRNYITNLLSLDFSANAWRWNFEHPPVTKYIAGLGALWSDGYGPARLLFALMGSATCVLACALGTRLFSSRVGLLAGVIVALFPRLVAHDVIIGHETPSVFFWALAMWLAVSDRGFSRRLILIGIVVGLAVATRFANVLLAPLVVATLFIVYRRALRPTVLLVPLCAFATFVAVWPLMWSEPVRHLSAAWKILGRQHLPEYYLGELIRLPPWHYFPVYVLATLPVGVLGALLLAAWRGVTKREQSFVILMLFVLTPLGIALSPVRQDGVRYVLPVFVPLAILAAAGVENLTARMKLATVLVGMYLVITLMRIHPYYLDYYGEQVGGADTVARHEWFEIGWWGEGIGNAVDYVNRHAARNARVLRAVSPTHLNWLRADLWSDGPPDWIITNAQGQIVKKITLPQNTELVHQEQAQGAPLVTVYRVVR
ncbi:MAG: glycosyltransferase family 39 protein [Chloroflexi bacterium]|nr:glycosyltransferase family 39 protein [Chloroflexota bacterium]